MADECWCASKLLLLSSKVCLLTIQIGCDYAGVVEEVGSKVTKDLKKGDRVCGFCHGGNEVNHEDGAFGEYVTAKGDVQIKIPDNLSFEEASTLGVGITTYVLNFCQRTLT